MEVLRRQARGSMTSSLENVLGSHNDANKNYCLDQLLQGDPPFIVQ